MSKGSRIVLVVAVLFTGAIFAQDAIQGEPSKLQGTWQVLRKVYDGTDETTEDIRLVIAPGQIVIKDQRREQTIRYTLDPATMPKHIDLTLPAAGNPVPVTGIYSLEGDTLKICFGSEKGQARPTEFTSPKGSRLILYVLKRLKG